MKKLYAPLLATLLLVACKTSSLTDAQLAPVDETNVAFSGQLKDIDLEQSVISFVGKSNIVDHEGKFNTYTADIDLDPTTPADLEKAKVSAEIDLDSLETDSDGLEGHLKKDDFFSTATYPKATFVSSKITNLGDNMYAIDGTLTVKGMSKEISLEAEITDDYFTAHYDFPRKEFGIGNDSYGSKLLDETVPVDVKLVFQK